MQEVLENFCQISGQKVNLNKSRIWYTPNTPSHLVSTITSRFGIATTKDLGMYPGVPQIHGRTRRQHFHKIVERVHKRLGGWKTKILSRAARLVLIQSVLSAAPVYTMQSCKLPGRTIEELEKCSRDFFWGDSCTQQRSTHEVSWPTICQPKAVGGLGIRPLLQVNQGLLEKTELEMSTSTGKTVGTSANSQVWAETGR